MSSRAEQGMLSWIGRTGSQTIRNALRRRLPKDNKRANSIRGLQPLNLDEEQETRRWNAGKFFSSAGRRAFASGERRRGQNVQDNRLRRRREGERPAAGGLDGAKSQPMYRI